MKKIKSIPLLLCASLLISARHAEAQKEFKNFAEFRLGAGAGMFFGDLGGSLGSRKEAFLDLDLRTVRPNVSLGARLNFTHWLALRADLSVARFVGDDAHSEDGSRFMRNLHFRSNLSELAVNAEITIMDLSRWQAIRNKTAMLYLFGGVGAFKFNPQAKYNGEWVDLQPLGTEGQGLEGYNAPYKRTSFAIPFGFGIRRQFGQTQYFGFELAMRKSYTDYIDDVSGSYPDMNLLELERGSEAVALSDRSLGEPKDRSGNLRGNPNRNDNFSFLQFTYAYGFGKRKVSKARTKGWFAGNKDALRCPMF